MKLDKTELERVVALGLGKKDPSAAVSGKKFFEEHPIHILNAEDPAASDKKKFKITVEGVSGTCVARHKAGEVFYMQEDKTPEGICLTAFSGLLPYINAMICNAKFDWEPAEGRIRLGCPDPDNNVVFLIEEIK